MFAEIEPIQAFAIGAALAAVVALGLILSQRQRLNTLRTERRRLEAVAVKAREILSAAPDGLMLWDQVTGGFTCSRRLAVLLNLSDGVQSHYDDVRQCFEGDSLKVLEQCVSLLRAKGTPFDVLLSTKRRRIQAVGARAETDDGDILADMVWMRDITAAGSAAPGSRIPTVNASGLEDRHLTALLDTFPFPVWLRDSNLALAFVNQAGKDVAPAETALAERARQQGMAVTERNHQESADGAQEQWLEITELPLGSLGGGEDGENGGTMGFAIDRSEAERLRGATAKETDARNDVLKNLDSAIAIFAANTTLEYFNPAYAALWGLDGDWLKTGPEYSAVLERMRELRSLPEVSNFRDFKFRQIEQFETLDGTEENLMHLPDGRTVRATVNRGPEGGLVFVFENVSEKLDLERSYKSLDAVQREAFDNLHEGIAVFGSDGRLKLFNPVFTGLWELSEETLDESFHVTGFVDYMRSAIAVEGGWDDLSWGIHKDKVVERLMGREGTTGKLELANGTVIEYANIPLPDGAMLLSYLDVTDTARVESALRQQAEAYADADRLKTEFIAKVSYEARTPLTTVIGFAEMLNQEFFGKLNRRQGEYTKGILDTSGRLLSMLGDIFDLASIEAGRLELDRDTIDVHGLLVSALNLIQDRARARNMKLEFDCPPDIGWITADEKRLKQVIFNLLSNAVTFTPERGTVRLESRREGDDIVLIVADTGAGIPKDDRERLFRPFEKGKDATGDSTGAGLGLSLVRNFIELHGGSVDIKSPPGRGTTVTCRLPAGGNTAGMGEDATSLEGIGDGG
ncbi:MAG: PAS-domain containing protein [Alphaproteobacteria bacterium]|nr:PAS-domain containing protein [Alphaproteobacteria bacterium]